MDPLYALFSLPLVITVSVGIYMTVNGLWSPDDVRSFQEINFAINQFMDRLLNWWKK
jgi:hypothetical protein